MSAGLYGSADGVNRQIKKLYVNVGGVNRELKELWAVKDGVNRKIFSSQKITVTTKALSDGSNRYFASWNPDGSGELYLSRYHSDGYYLEISTDMQFDPAILVTSDQIVFDAVMDFNFRVHPGGVVADWYFYISINNADFSLLYKHNNGDSYHDDRSLPDIHLTDTSNNIALTKLSLKARAYLVGTGENGRQSSIDVTWSSGDIRIAGKPITEVIVSST